MKGFVEAAAAVALPLVAALDDPASPLVKRGDIAPPQEWSGTISCAHIRRIGATKGSLSFIWGASIV